ncbi:hypothetical protein MRX96_033943 [Rhipicephalus microplus]
MLQPSWDSASKETLSSSPNYKGAVTIAAALWARWLRKTMSSNKLVFTVHMTTAALCHVFLPLVQTVCTWRQWKHAPSFNHYPNQIAVTLVLGFARETHID